MIDEKLEMYATDHTSSEPELLERLAVETNQKMKSPQMLTGRLQGIFLRMLVKMLRARRIIEVGMFTGYGSLMMASALPEDGKLITCEVDPEAEAVARRYFSQSPHGYKIDIRMGSALETLRLVSGPFDFAYIDADKKSYPTYYEMCLEKLGSGGVMAIDNVLWSGGVLEPRDEEARAIAALNDRVCEDSRVEHVLLPIRDGLMLVEKR